MTQFNRTVFFSLLLVLLSRHAHCGEIYYVDDSPLFLYKTINWWYDCLPEESKKLCGRPIKCSNTGNARVEYDEHNKNLALKIKGGLAAMLLVFKKCTHCYGPSHLRCIWLDQIYLNGATANVILSETSIIRGFTFSGVEKDQAEHIQSISHDIQFTLEGVIGGLSNGQIALHAYGDLLKGCSNDSPDPQKEYPITIKIINSSSNRIIAIFNMSWES